MSKSISTDDDENSAARRFQSTAHDEAVETDEYLEKLEVDYYCSVLDGFGCEAYEEISLTDDDEKEPRKPRRWIRIQAGPDKCLDEIQTREDVLARLQQVREKQSQVGRTDLYERSWEPTKIIDESVNGEPTASSVKHNVPSFSVCQFNTLAEGLSSGPSVKTPFQRDSKQAKDTMKNSYGGFTNVNHPDIALNFDLRRWRVLEVLLENKSPFDLIALEEVDRFRGFYLPMLKLFGYRGLFMPKIRAPGFHLGWYSDGCALFWKHETFELVSTRSLIYETGTQVLVLATLRHRQTGRYIVTAVTHLKASRSDKNERIRCGQVKELLRRVDNEVEAAKSLSGREDVPAIILGDFNADPPLEMLLGKESCVGMVLKHGADYGDGEARYQSAYPVDPPDPSYFTTWKTRGPETVKRIIDYIFYSKELTCTHTLCIPSELEELPGLRYPSDHLMIAAKFEL